MDVRKCKHITKLEHTIANLSFTAPRRGNIGIRLISPSGTPSQLLSTRPKDHTGEGLEEWPFMTVHNWGENPSGKWVLEVSNTFPSDDVWKDFLLHESEDDDKDKDSDEEDQYVDLVPRLMEDAVLVNWGFVLYGTGKEKDAKGKEEDEEDDNPAINPELSGQPANSDTIIDIWNDEQADDEEINIDPEDLSPDADIPPNVQHNFEDGEIDTGAFDGHVADDDTLSLTQEAREVILKFLIALDENDLDEVFTKKEQSVILQFLLSISSEDLAEFIRQAAMAHEYARMENAILNYKMEAALRQRAEKERIYREANARAYLYLEQMRRQEILQLIQKIYYYK